jgi:glyoxylase-like metal-dependent hydrolase (beta-lactamase superfamily II)
MFCKRSLLSIFFLAVLPFGVNYFSLKDFAIYHLAETSMQLPVGLGNPNVHKLETDVLAITGLYHTSIAKGFSVNSGMIFTDKSIIFIDCGMTIASAEFLWKLAQESMRGGERLYLILTHHHSDHVFGMRVFKEKGAQIIAHKGVKEELENDNGRYKTFIAERMGWDSKKADEILGNVIISIPDRTIEKDETICIDGEKIFLLTTPGHVPDEICVYHPKSRTLFAGDAIYEGSNLNTSFGGPDQWREWIVQLERLKKLSVRTIVPGHGNLCSVSEIDRNIDYLTKMLRSNCN